MTTHAIQEGPIDELETVMKVYLSKRFNIENRQVFNMAGIALETHSILWSYKTI